MGNNWQEERRQSWSGPCPFNFPTEVHMSGEMAGALRSQKQQKEQLGVGQGSREGKGGEIGHGDAVFFYSHSEADAPTGSQKQQENFDIH